LGNHDTSKKIRLKKCIIIGILSRKDELKPTQSNSWEREVVANMASTFGSDKSVGIEGAGLWRYILMYLPEHIKANWNKKLLAVG
jgi:hypothetical protein